MSVLLRFAPHLVAAAVLVLSGVWLGSQPANRRADRAELALAHLERDIAQRVALAEQAARAEELDRLAAVNRAAAKQAEELEHARDREADRADALAAGNLRLRHDIAALATAGLSCAAAAAAEPDGAAERGAAYLASAVRVGAECDARQRALIEAYEANR